MFMKCVSSTTCLVRKKSVEPLDFFVFKYLNTISNVWVQDVVQHVFSEPKFTQPKGPALRSAHGVYTGHRLEPL